MRIVIVGAGAIGSWIAARLALAGHRVTAFRRGGSVDAIRLTEQRSEQVVRLEHEPGVSDLIVIAVKAPGFADAAEAARSLMSDHTLVLPMLNGIPWWFLSGEPLRSVDPDGRIAAALPLERAVGCVIHASCRTTGPNAVEVVHADKLILGEPGGEPSERIVTLAERLERAGIRVELSDNVRRAIWYKLWGNATLNPLSALTRATAEQLLADRELRAFMLDAMEELAAIGAAIGCPIGESGEDRMAVTARLGAFRTSMLQDVEAGRPIELEALLGAPREIAQRAKIPTPKLDLLYAETRLMAASLGLL